jgi:uncharacterized membrane protein YhaH (DUF805 family)
MSSAFWKWIAWFLFLFVLDFTVPFLLLKDIPKMTGSFLFWLLWVIAAMGSMFLIFLRWRGNHREVNHE